MVHVQVLWLKLYVRLQVFYIQNLHSPQVAYVTCTGLLSHTLYCQEQNMGGVVPHIEQEWVDHFGLAM